jgi:hypothetical protein
MRHIFCAAAVCLVLGLTAPVRAQGLTNFFPTGTRTSLFSGGAQTVVNTPIDTSLSVVPFTGPTGQDSGLSSLLPSFFRNLLFPSFPPIIGGSNLPSPTNYPGTGYESGKPVPFIPVNGQNRDNNPIRRLMTTPDS